MIHLLEQGTFWSSDALFPQYSKAVNPALSEGVLWSNSIYNHFEIISYTSLRFVYYSFSVCY